MGSETENCEGSGVVSDLARQIDKVFKDCLYSTDESTDQAVVVDGLVIKFGFHPIRLSENKSAVQKFISEMKPEFIRTKGGGWSFLNLCFDKHDVQWGEHINCEQLVALAIALKLGEYLMPREMWEVLPGGMPYVVFDELK